MLNTDTDSTVIDLRLGRHRYWYLMEQHRLLPQVRGGDGDDGGGNDDGDDDGDDDAPKFTQADLDRLGAKEKRQGKRAAIRELMERFGFATVEEAEEFITATRNAAPKSKPKGGDDDDGDDGTAAAVAAAAEADRKAKDREAAAARKETDVDIRIALLAAGAPSDKTKLAKLTRMVDVEPGADEDTIDDAVEDLKKEWPALFATDDANDDDDDDDSSSLPDNAPAPSGGKRKRPKEEDGFSKADRRFEERHGKRSS